MSRLLLVDGHSNLYRAFFALKTRLTAPDGTPTGAVYGFLRMFHKMLRELAPTHVAVAFDVSRETFRTRMLESYKAQRQPMPEELRAQVPLVQKALELLGIKLLLFPDVEADDMMASLAARAAGEGHEVIIATVDKDLMQLVRDPHIRLWHTRLERLLDEAGVAEVFGVPPAQVVEVLALEGDASDNIPGCPGVGEKTARELIRRFGSVEAMYERLSEVTPPRAQKALAENRKLVALSRELVELKRDLELPFGLEELARRPPSPELANFYRSLGFASLLAELGEAPAPAPAEGVALPRLPWDRLIASLNDAEPWALRLWDGELFVASPAGWAAAPAAQALADLTTRLSRAWCHDAKALLAGLRDLGLTAETTPNDTMLAGYVLAPGEAVELSALCARYKVPAPALATPEGELQALLALAPVLGQAMEAEGVVRVYRELELPLVPVLEDMERVGVKLDVGFLSELSREVEKLLAEREREIFAEAGGSFNINSPKQLAEVLFQWKGMPVLRRTSKTRVPSTDADVLQELALQGFRLPALILEYRELSKLKSTYLDALPAQVRGDGRIHTRFNQAVTATGRLSSSDPNLQNIPIRSELGREVRRAFVADSGKLLVVADYSQIELRVLAHLSQDPALVSAFSRGEDIHAATASLVFGVAPELVTPDMRRAAKTINFGLIYGMGAYALSRELGVSQREAQTFIDNYFARLPKVREYLEGVKEEARRTGKVRTLFGRVRHIAGLSSQNANVRGNAERMAINAPVQGTAADLMKLAMIRTFAALKAQGFPARVLLQVHDELVLEAEHAKANEVASLVKATMEHVAELAVPLKADVGVGPSWADAKG
ncbi:MAG: DNA polymerase I, thermostable [Thermoanaerobaculum sp.]|nr:MAG: DNA polymerase I, thermostable [Thermoanaerobaculum sp.]